jgi:hypothetical protein
MPEEGFFRAGRTRPGPNVHGPRTGTPGGGPSRRPRWDTDAGITDRDVAALRWLGQQYAARSDVLRVLLGRLSPGSPRVEGLIGEATLRDVVDRWEDRGLVARDRLLGHLWVAPTVKALRLVGLDVRAWSFVIPQLAHVHAVGVVRLALEPSIPAGGRWLSERELRREAGKSHVPDAAVQLPDTPDLEASAGLYDEDVDPLPRRIAVEVELTRKGAARLLASPRGQKLTAPALGIALDGDLASWRQGRYVVPPAQLRGKAMAVVGAPGAGKTVTLLRLAYLAGVLGRKVCFVDCKGTDPTLVPALIAAYRLGNPTARIGTWPDTAMDMWRGSPVQVASRLLAVEQFTEPFYQRVASAGLRLALTAPDMPPVEGSDELLRRLDVDELAVLWEGRPLQLKDIEAIADHLAGARLRYADFFAALGGAFDRGTWSYEDVDLAVLTSQSPASASCWPW